MLVENHLKTSDKARAFYEHHLQHELYVLRLLGIAGSILTMIMMYVDYTRVPAPYMAVFLRSIALLWQIAALFVSFSKTIKVFPLQLFVYALTTSLFALPFFMDYTSGMPNFFLTNYLCLYFFLFNAPFGHPLRFKLIQTLLVIIAFVMYANYWSPHSTIHNSQTFNIIMNAVLSLIIAILIDRYKVVNYSKQVLLDESRESSAKMNEMKTKLISMLSHDFVSPINNLTSLIKLQESGQISQAELGTYSKKIKHALENLSSMMRSLLNWSRLQLDGLKFKPSVIDLNKLVNEVIGSLDFAIEEKQVKIINQIEPNGHVMADGEIIKMALRNFISNAIKFSKGGSSIHIQSERKDNSLTLKVKDEGVGMSDEQQKNLFDNTLKSMPGTQGEKGSGIGLLVTKDFVEMVGGRISVQSKLNEGSEFAITLPVQPVKET